MEQPIELSEKERQELIDLLCGLIQQESENPPGNEEGAARFIADFLIKEGLDVELREVLPGRPNVIARLKGERPGKTLLLNGHTDVVPRGEGWSVDPFAAVIKDGRIIGRGAADMKSGVAAMMYAAALIKRRGLSFAGEMILLFNVDEERVNLGMKNFVDQKIPADYAIIGEPTELEVCIAHKGVSRYRLTTSGTPGHAAKTKNPDSAITKMARLLPILESECLNVKTKRNETLGNASMVITVIGGGAAPNIVPQSCFVEIDRRVLPGETKEQVYAELQQALTDGLAGEAVPYELDNYLFIPASSIDRGHALVGECQRAVKSVNGEAKVGIFDATCEAPFFSVDMNIPTVIMGPGELSQAHVKDEYVKIDEYINAAKVYTQLFLSLLS